jgi:hypothetical protein
MFGMNGIGGSGFSVSSPTNGSPGSINASLGAFNPMYGNYAGAAGNYNNMAMGLANTASSGATGAYQSALASMMPQLQNMQQNLLAANNNSLFQRGQLGSGSMGQYGNPNNPTNLTTASLGAGFAQQDLQAIMAAQNQGLNFFNSNMAGAQGLGNLGFGSTNAGMGMLNAQNSLAQNPLAFAGLSENSKLGATGDMASMIRASNPQGVNFGGGYGGLGANGASGTMNGLNNLVSGGKNLYNDISSWFGSGANGGLDASQNATIDNMSSWIGGPSGAGGQAATGGGQIASGAQSIGGPAYAGYDAAIGTGAAPAIAAPAMADVAGIGSSDAAATLASGFNPATASFATDAAASTGGDAAAGIGGSALGMGALALAAPLAMIAFGASQKPWTFNSDYHDRINSEIAAGPGQFASKGGFNGSYWDPQYMDYESAKEELSGHNWNEMVSSGQVPFAPGVTLGHSGAHNASNF